jgi:hypothetical protein
VAFFPWAMNAAMPAVPIENTTACATYSRSAAARRSSAPNDSAVHGEELRVPYACIVSLIAPRNSSAASWSLPDTPALKSGTYLPFGVTVPSV